MTTVLLALIPLLLISGVMSWVMTMGARDQARSDAWALQWQRANGPAHGR